MHLLGMGRRLVVRHEHQRAGRRPDVLIGAGTEKHERREALHEQPPGVRHGPDQQVAAEGAREAPPERGLVHVPDARRVHEREGGRGGGEEAFGGGGQRDEVEDADQRGGHAGYLAREQ